MQRDLRDTALYQEAASLFEALRQPGTGQISDAAEVHASHDGRYAVFTGTIMEKLEGSAPTRICVTDLASGDTRVLTFGPNNDRLPKFSPDGRQIAFLSDRGGRGDFQLYLLDVSSGAARPAAAVGGWVEYLHWSPDSKRILLGVAGHGADIAGGQGATKSARPGDDEATWMPAVETGDESCRWRRAWVYEIASGGLSEISWAPGNVWEAVWCGNDALAAVMSDRPAEGNWYEARLHVLDLGTRRARDIYVPEDQLGWPAASPSGRRLAVVEAICSDRWIVAGDLRLIDTRSGEVEQVETKGIDVTCVEWRSESVLLLAGHRGFETVVALYDVASKVLDEVWRSREVTAGGRYISVAGFGERGDCALLTETFVQAPALAMIRERRYHAVRSFDLARNEVASALPVVEPVSWRASDGVEIQGWLLSPHRQGPHPLIMAVHGGPVWHWRPSWLGRPRTLPFLVLVKHGFAVFLPNPRGSSGRGHDFARRVIGDMGGADAQDCLAGIDFLIQRGVADAGRLGVTGISYGGFMASWLVTRDSRFAAAVAVAPVTNQLTQHLLSNIPQFVSLFLADSYTNFGGEYFRRSPVMYASQVKAAVLNICGALDLCTPPAEAIQFHNALVENGARSALVTYPEEGHGVQRFPAAIDYAARLVAWFEQHMQPAYSS